MPITVTRSLPISQLPALHRHLTTPRELNVLSRSPIPNLQQQLQRILNHLLELLDPLASNSTVDNLVVEATGDYYLVVPLNRCALLGLDGDGDLLGGSDGEDAGLWWVNDGCEAVNGRVHAHVADGESSALVLLWLQLAVSGALAEILDLCGDGLESEAFD